MAKGILVIYRKVFLMLLLGVMCGSALSAEPVNIIGKFSCGSWVKARVDKDWETLVQRSWLHGFLTGIAIESKHNFLSGTDSDSIALWVDGFCNANPLEDVGTAGIVLAAELKQRNSYK